MKKILITLCFLTLVCCEGTMPTPPSMQMNPAVISNPTSLGFPALNTKSAQFQNKSSWSEFIETLKKTKNNEIVLGDWQALSEFNQEAEEIWSELLRCNNSDAEKIRANYSSGQLCEQEKNEGLQNRIRSFHISLENFLHTTLYYSPRAEKRQPGTLSVVIEKWAQRGKVYYDDDDKKVVDWKNARNQKLPLFHPFFIQAIVEYMNVINRVSISAVHSPYGTHANFNEKVLLDFQFSHFTTGFRATELVYWKELGGQNLLDASSTYATARAYSNSWYLFSLVGSQSCAQLGLWPEVSYASLIILAGQYTDASREIARSIQNTKCGGEIPILDVKWKQEPAKMNDRDIVLSLRKLGYQYGYHPFDQVHCLDDLPQGESPNNCYTVDPAAPQDISDYKDLVLGVANQRLERMKRSFEFIFYRQ